jgi:MGT family glycosyltransferase
MVDLDRAEPRLGGETRTQWETVKRRAESGRSGRPLIYCSLGSYWADMKFLRMIVDTFTRRPEWDLILGLGKQARSADFGVLPDNVTILEWAPQLEVLALADLAINHAGVTSVNECITLGVPIIAYSPSLTDQDGVASRIAFHGLGLAAEWDTGNPTQLERNIQRVLEDESFRANVQAMGAHFKRYETDHVAERTIEGLLESGGAVR